MTRTILTLAAAVALAVPGTAQVSITALAGAPFTEDFTGYTGAGFDPTPAPGTLDSDIYAISGFDDNSIFGSTTVTGDAARGLSTGPESTGGVYAVEVSPGNHSWGVQPGGSDFTLGRFYVRFANDTGAPVTVTALSYDVYVRNDQGRSNRFDLAYTVIPFPVANPAPLDFTAAGAPFAYTSPEASAGTALTLGASPSGPVKVRVPAGSELILAFEGDDVGGAGSRDEFSVDNLSVSFGPAPIFTSATPGYRLLSVPGAALDVDALAQIDLVSGAGGYTEGDADCSRVTNLFTVYTGDETAPNGGYTAPATGSTLVEPGAGFFWYLFGEDNPNANFPANCETPGGTMSSAGPLPLGLPYTEVAMEPDASVAVSGRAASDDAFFLGGNPFTQDLDLEGDAMGLTSITAVGGATFSNVVQAYDPDGGYVMFTAENDTGTSAGGTSTADDVSVWQGFFLEALDPADAVTAILYEADYRTGASGEAGFVGRLSALAQLRLKLVGTLAGGAAVADDAIGVVFAEGSTDGWDGYDATKLEPFSADFAEVALRGLGRDGSPVLKASDSYALDAQGEIVVPARFRASAAGAFELAWEGGTLPAGWAARLRDTATGAETSLTQTGTYAFDGEAGSADRFEIVVAPLVVAGSAAAATFTLSQLAPNPTAGVARMALTVEAAEAVTVRVYDTLGRRVVTVLDDVVTAGSTRRLALATAGLAAGVYVVRVEGTSFAETRRLTVTR